MGGDRITVKELREWLEDFPEQAEVAFIKSGELNQDTAWELREITVRPIDVTTPRKNATAWSVIFLGVS